MKELEEENERVVFLAPAEHGGLFPIYERGEENAEHIRVVVHGQPFLKKFALSILRRYVPAYRQYFIEVHFCGKRKQENPNK